MMFEISEKVKIASGLGDVDPLDLPAVDLPALGEEDAEVDS
jgi:hypothetical protein